MTTPASKGGTSGARGVPGPRGLPIVGSALDMVRDPLRFLEQSAANYGPIFEVKLGNRHLVFVSSAELAEPILGREFEDTTIATTMRESLYPMLGESVATTVDAQFWNTLHRQMLPMMSPRMMRNYFESTVEAIIDEVADLDRYAASGEVVELYPAIKFGTFLALTRTLFNRGMAPEEIPLILTRFTSSNKYIAARYLTNASPLVNAFPAVRQGKKDLDAINARAHQLIGERRRTRSGEAEDMLDILIDAVDDKGTPLSDERIRENVTALWFGGQETTPTVATWAFGLMAADPTIYQGVLDEVDEVLGDRKPTFADLDRLRYTQGVIDEAMRLYPPFVFLQREAIRDFELGGYPMRTGQQFAFFAYGIHREEKNWPQPERVDPLRHRPELRKERERCAYLPFGYGKRRCLGSRVGQMESLLMVAMISQRLIFRHANGMLPKAKAQLSIHPDNGMPVHVTRRQAGAPPPRRGI
ncbi:cytochrome P450 [Mycobacterium sp. CVI_P3]|uniref:Cytochrome P450 n=1 Tax=Mycobacterium pinniadriaticum TaxID=2994102 RepID=A0ABT3SD73_9MYCO|nr:cytochrome P450 [Mycobacterium pinniadriaticum]MCX2930669.1 cytochrome P450 [Mycobacterium pinniadriaticum]MCX2937093.1 cytochrome P450 [Mycobacterium pinniadriaticum]